MKLHRLNLLFSLASLNVVLVTIERFSFTTTIILQPYAFLRLHEVVQIVALILATVVIPYFTLHYISSGFTHLKSRQGTILGLLFIVGVYFYATGNGIHELGSFLFNTYCDTQTLGAGACGSMFFNDYYVGNTLYFLGAFGLYLPLVLLERRHPDTTFGRHDLPLLVVNALVYAFTIFAYAAFDLAPIGLIYAIGTMVVIDVLLVTARQRYLALPFTLYCSLAYTLGAVASLGIRALR